MGSHAKRWGLLMSQEVFKDGDLCPYCNKGKLGLCPEIEPWSEAHLTCEQCDSTYTTYQNIEQMIELIEMERADRINWKRIVHEDY